MVQFRFEDCPSEYLSLHTDVALGLLLDLLELLLGPQLEIMGDLEPLIELVRCRRLVRVRYGGFCWHVQEANLPVC